MILPPDDYTLVSAVQDRHGDVAVTLWRKSTGRKLGHAEQRAGESSWAIFDDTYTVELGRATSLRHAAAMLRHHHRRNR